MAKEKQSILIVEDELPQARVLSIKLKNAGYEVQIADNGKKAINYVNNHKDDLDLILLDLIMPIMDGFEVLENLYKMKCKIPIIVVSNLNDNRDMQKAKELGATDFRMKADTQLTELVELAKKTLSK